mgnify:CR=1 FL=1
MNVIMCDILNKYIVVVLVIIIVITYYVYHYYIAYIINDSSILIPHNNTFTYTYTLTYTYIYYRDPSKAKAFIIPFDFATHNIVDHTNGATSKKGKAPITRAQVHHYFHKPTVNGVSGVNGVGSMNNSNTNTNSNSNNIYPVGEVSTLQAAKQSNANANANSNPNSNQKNKNKNKSKYNSDPQSPQSDQSDPHSTHMRSLYEQYPMYWKNNGRDHYLFISTTIFHKFSTPTYHVINNVCRYCQILSIETNPTKTPFHLGSNLNYIHAMPYPSSFHYNEDIVEYPWSSSSNGGVGVGSGRDITSLFIGKQCIHN